MFHRQRQRRGFTLVELLVVIAILGVLLGMLLAAVQKAREGANRATCKNNLRQMGLALHICESTNGWFPPSSVTAAVPEAGVTGASPSSSWVPFILPFLEQNNLSLEYDLNKPWYDPANHTAAMTPLPIMICPSSQDHKRTDNYVGGGHTITPYGACSDYGALEGAPVVYWSLTTGGYTDKYPWATALSALQANKTNPIINITDGLSNTILVAECSERTYSVKERKVDKGLYIIGGAWARPENALRPDGSLYDGNTNGNGTGPCTMNCTNIYNIYSFHDQGCNFLMCDGSVQFIRQSITWQILARMMTRNSGEDVPGDAF
jgi:prepilin-type N-terminal cleavage/methylation domain-containing protein/prepilin-type processing-associated H-X9-DG protein